MRVDLKDYLGELAADGPWPVFYCPNPGNAGDSAIALGAYQLFDRAGLPYELVQWYEDFDSTGKTLIYGGGGNLAVSYPHARGFIERHHRQAQKLIVLPHTVQGNEDLLRQLGANVDIFCRERHSFQWVVHLAPNANVYLSDDLAFHLDARQLLSGSRISPAVLARWIVSWPIRGMAQRFIGRAEDDDSIALRPALKQGVHALLRLAQPGSNRRLHAIRTDREKEGSAPPSGNVDVSQVFAYGTAPRAMALRATRAMLTYLDQFERITTNRLHICILAILIGKEVDFYANSYFKNEAVYEYSIKDRYPNVRWCGQWQGA